MGAAAAANITRGKYYLQILLEWAGQRASVLHLRALVEPPYGHGSSAHAIKFTIQSTIPMGGSCRPGLAGSKRTQQLQPAGGTGRSRRFPACTSGDCTRGLPAQCNAAEQWHKAVWAELYCAGTSTVRGAVLCSLGHTAYRWMRALQVVRLGQKPPVTIQGIPRAHHGVQSNATPGPLPYGRWDTQPAQLEWHVMGR